jgi:hypothetical protein
MRISLIFVLTFLFGTSVALGQESFTLKFKKDAGPGGTVLVEKRDIVKTRSKLIASKTSEALEDNQQSRVTSFKYRETMLERDPGEKDATRLRRHYEIAQVKEQDAEPAPLPIQGKTVLIEKLDDKHRFRFEDGRELTAKEAEELVDEFQNKAKPRLDLDELIARDTVRLGDTHQINPRLLVKVFTPLVGARLIDEFQPKGEWKLVRAYRKDERQYGVIELRITLPLQELTSFVRTKTKQPGERLFMKPGATLRIVLTVDGCIDAGTTDLTTKLNMFLDGTADVPGRDNPLFQLLLTVETASETVIRDPARAAQ